MKWEYKIQKVSIGMGDLVEQTAEVTLNELGEEGWEAVGWWHSQTKPLDVEGRDTLLLFKRPISGQPVGSS
jgi:hypothetical protein